MDRRSIISKYAVIGDQFELAEDVYLEWDESGRFTRIEPGNASMEADNSIAFCLGTDNVMVNAPNLWREMQFAIKVLRVQDPTIKIDPTFWLKTVTLNGAKAMGLENIAGSLGRGKTASFILVSLVPPAIKPAPSPLTNMVLWAATSDGTRVFYSRRRVRW